MKNRLLIVGVSLAIFWGIAGASPAHAQVQYLDQFERSIAEDFSTLRTAQAELKAAIQSAAAVAAAGDPERAKDEFRTGMIGALDTVEAKAAAVMALLSADGALPSQQALQAFAEGRKKFVREAGILEEDRAALLRIWDEIGQELAANIASVQAIGQQIQGYKERLSAQKIALGEFLVVGDIENIARIVAETTAPTAILDLDLGPTASQ